MSTEIPYVRDSHPPFEFAPYAGRRYEQIVPDTLDLYERAMYSVNVLTNATDPDADYEIYMSVAFRTNPPVMWHTSSDFCTMKFMEALPLMRLITGSEENLHVERRWMEVLLSEIGEDGQVYMPKPGRPWAFEGYFSHVSGVNERVESEDQHVIPIYSGRVLSALATHYQREPAEVWRDAAVRIVDGLRSIVVDTGDYAYFAPSCMYYLPGATEDYGIKHRLWGTESREISLSLLHVYRAMGYEPALTLAKGIIDYIIRAVRAFDEDGSFTPDDYLAGKPQSHFHVHTAALQSILEYGIITRDSSYIQLAKRGFEYARSAGEVITGYFPEFVNSKEHEECELCCVADMLALAVKLSEVGVGDYWDDVDRWTRNMFAEGQLTPERKDALSVYASHLPPTDFGKVEQTPGLPINYTVTDRVLERNIGAFAGWCNPNDFHAASYGPQGVFGIMHCCTGNGTRAIYYVWKGAVQIQGPRTTVHFLANRASKELDIRSHVPYTGLVEIDVHESTELSVRLPEWISGDQLVANRNGTVASARIQGRYAELGRVADGDRITLAFPISERTDTVWIEKRRYEVIRRGNDIVHISPRGINIPLYQREHYRSGATRFRKMPRFATSENIHV